MREALQSLSAKLPTDDNRVISCKLDLSDGLTRGGNPTDREAIICEALEAISRAGFPERK